jgi:hypothetical protein
MLPDQSKLKRSAKSRPLSQVFHNAVAPTAITVFAGVGVFSPT